MSSSRTMYLSGSEFTLSDYRDEPPMGRPTEFGDLSPFTLERTEFLGISKSPVRYFPVMLRGQLIGYLWASESASGDAANFFPVHGLGTLGWNATGTWQGRLQQARESGMTPLEAVRHWVGKPEDSRGGAVPADSDGHVVADSQAVRLLTSRRPRQEG
ncbi:MULTISPECIES: hypothetical protein [unclassified Streptomyces]|uniref:hypothetical protein n=1 Tax=unclassified Streptomyces TaxID=2593676 RepID=UPI0036EAC64A